jgi:hypothetical protein
MGITPRTAAALWYADGTLWAVVGVVVAVVFGAITVWAQFASAKMIRGRGGPHAALDTERAPTSGGPPAAQALDLSGQWIAGWQSYKDGEEVLRHQPVEIEHVDQENLLMRALERGADVVDGGYLWEGELRLWDNAVLMGWYAATEGSIRSKGTLYFTLHPHGQKAAGRWVGLSHDGAVLPVSPG